MKVMIALLVFIAFNPTHGMDYYSFIIDGKKAGYFEVESRRGVLYQNAYIEMDGQIFENPFWVKEVNGKVTAYKFGKSKWVSLSGFPDNSYPTCAFELISRGLKDGMTLEYNVIMEGKGAVIGKAKLARTGNRITETKRGKVGRYLVLDNEGKITEYGWGEGARSLRAKSREDAVKNTVFAKRA